jgi:hypothetical protein
MVGNYVNHHPNIHGVGSVYKLLERSLITEVGINALPVSSPVAVIATVSVVNDRRYPNGIEPEILNILKLLLNTPKVSTTIVVKITKGSISVASPETISEKLINSSLLPLFSRS